MPRNNRHTSLPPPYLKRVWIGPVSLEDTDHYRMMREFILDPHGTVDTMIWS